MKRGNLKKKASAILLAATMTATSFPPFSAEVHAAELPETTQFATIDELKSFNTNDNDGSTNPAKVYFGQDGSGAAQAWWIAGSQNGNLTLFAASPLGTAQKFSEKSAGQHEYQDIYGCTYQNGAPTAIRENHYGASPLRTVLKSVETNTSYFSEAEQGLMNNTIIYTYDVGNYTTFPTYSTTDTLYLAYGSNEGNDNEYIMVGTNSAASLNDGLRIDRSYWGNNDQFWLRAPNPYSGSSALYVSISSTTGNRVGSAPVSSLFALVPAFELNPTSVLFASAVPVVSSEGKLDTEDVTNDGAFTLRYSASNLGSAQIAYDYSKVDLTGVPADVWLVAQNKDGAWAKAASGTTSVSASDMGIGSFENCRVWLEKTDTVNRMVRATMATMGTKEGYDVKIAENSTLNIISGNSTQSVNIGSAIEDIQVEAAEGYYLPDNYKNNVTLPAGLQAVQNGKTVTISGTPQSDVTITLPDAAEKTNRPDTPNVTGGIGMITGTDDTMEYASSADSATWEPCTDNSTKVGAGTWYVRYKETDTQKASTAKEVTVTASAYTISVDSDSLTFERVDEGYADVSAKSLKIKNTGNAEVTNINVALTGTNADAFTLDTSGMQTALAPTAETTVSVKPNTGLGSGVYQAELKITGDSGVEKRVQIAFAVGEHELPPAHTHSYGTEWKSDGESHWHECACGDRVDTAAHQLTWIIDKAATADEKGSKHEECGVCGYKGAAVEIPATGTTGFEYEILEGEDQTYSGSGGLVVRANGDFSKFTGLKVDGVAVDTSNYDAKPGSTVVTLKESYLSTLSDGSHTLTFVYNDGEISTNFTITDRGTPEQPETPEKPGTSEKPGTPETPEKPTGPVKDKPNTESKTNSDTNKLAADSSRSPETGDQTNISLYLLLFIMSGLTITFCTEWKRTKAHRHRL